MCVLTPMVLVSCFIGANFPVAPETIYAHLDQSLQQGNGSEANEYVQTILAQHPGYVPATLAVAEFSYLESGKGELFANYLQYLDKVLSIHRQYYSPQFEEQLKTVLQRVLASSTTSERNQSFGLQGLSELPLQYIALLLLSPMLTIDADNISQPISYKRQLSVAKDGKPSEIQPENVIAAFSEVHMPKPEELEELAALSQLPVDKGAPALLSLIGAFNPLVAQSAAETISDYGAAAKAAILASMSQTTLAGSRKLHIYALVRIGTYDAEIEEALSAIARKDARVKDYALKSLEFLSSKAGQGNAHVR